MLPATDEPIPTVRSRRQSRAVRPVSAGSLFLLVGSLGCLGIAGCQAWESHQILATYEHAQGHLVSKDWVRTGRSTSCIGTIAFIAADGQTYRTEIGGARSMHVGEPVEVLYLRDDPSMNRANAFSALWGYPSALTGLGCVLLFVWMVALGNQRVGRR
jgi:hypothetical protein